MAHLIIVRHAERDDTARPDAYRDQTENNDCPLSEYGFTQAAEKADLLRRFTADREIGVSRVLCSPFLRTRQTADAFGREFLCDPERDWRLAEGQNFHDPSFSAEFRAEIEAAGIPIPESFDQIRDRCRSYLESVSGGELVVTHGIICNLLLQAAVPEYEFNPDLSSKDYLPRYTDTTILRLDGDRWTVVASDLEALGQPLSKS